MITDTGDTAIHRPPARPAPRASADSHPNEDPARRRNKSGKRPPRRILGLWARLGLLAFAVGVLILAAAGLVAKAVRPYQEARGQVRQLSATERQIAALDQENAALARRIAYMKTPDGVATAARRLGYLRPGEISIVLEAPAAPRPEAAPAPATRPKTLRDRMGRFWRSLTGH